MKETLTAATGWELKEAQRYWPFLGLSDLAHVLSLMENNLVPRDQGQRLLKGLMELQNTDPENLRLSEKQGDLFKNRLHILREKNSEAAKWYGTGRARRELTTVAFHLLIKEKLLELSRARLNFVGKLNELAKEHQNTLMADYTYLQPAQVSTLGYYLSSFLGPVLRNADRAQACFQRVNLSPAGVGSTNGSSLDLNRDLLARRLGFTGCVENSRDGVWQSDLGFELAWLFSSETLVLARFCEDFLVWCTREFDFFELSDENCRGSVAMPQKKNPYSLNFVRGVANLLSGRVSGAFALGRTATNQIDNRIFLYNELPESCELVIESYEKLTKVLDFSKVNSERLEQRAQDQSLLAMDIVEALISKEGVSQSQAHLILGRALKDSQGDDLSEKVSTVFAQVTQKELSWEESQWKKVLRVRERVGERNDRGGASSASLEKSLFHFKEWQNDLTEKSQSQTHDWEKVKQRILSATQEEIR